MTPEGVIRRDEIVFEKAFDKSIPILMVVSSKKFTAFFFLNLFNFFS